MIARHRGTAILILLGLMALGAGCGDKKEQLARNLKPHEAETLLALQSARRGPMPEDPTKVKIDPARLEAHADRLAMQEEYEAALLQYQRALTMIKEEQHAWSIRYKMAAVSLQARIFASAQVLYRDLANQYPDKAEFWQGLGLAEFGLDQLNESAYALKEALDRDPKLWKAHNALGIIQNRWQDPDKALSHFRAALALNPRNPTIHNNLGVCHMLRGDLEAAEKSFRLALSLNPNYARASNNLGLVLARMGRDAEALMAFERGTGPAEANNNLGCVKAWQGDYESAATYFNQAIQQMPRYYPKAGDHLDRVKLNPLPPKPPAKNP